MANTLIKSFLVGLGFQVDSAGLRRFTEGLSASHKVVRDFAVGITGMAVAVEEAIRRTARQFENLFYLSQKTGIAVRDLQAARFAFGQVGLDAEAMSSTLAGIAAAFRDNPGLRGLANAIVPGFKNSKELMEGFARQYETLIRQFGRDTPEFEAASIPLRRIAEALHMSAEDLYQMAQNFPAYNKGIADAQKVLLAFGLDSETATRLATEVGREWNLVWLNLTTAFNVFIAQTFPLAKELLESFSRWLATDGAEYVNKWVGEFKKFLDNPDTVNNLKQGLVDTLGVVRDIASATGDVVRLIGQVVAGWQAAVQIVREYYQLGQAQHQVDIPADVEKRLQRPSVAGVVARWLFQGGPAPWEAGADKPVGMTPMFTTPIPPVGRQGSLQPGLRASPASFTMGGGTNGEDAITALFYLLGTWLKGSPGFRPIVMLADEFYTKFADTMERLLGLGGGSFGGSALSGATPGRGPIGPRGGSSRYRGGGGGGTNGGGSSATPGGGASVPTGENFNGMVKILTDLGVAPEVAQGAIAYSSWNESGLNQYIVNKQSGAYGKLQWLGPRLRRLRERFGNRPTSAQQDEFMKWELQNTHKHVLDALKSSKTQHEGYSIWGAKMEAPGTAALANAEAEYRRRGGKINVGSGNTAGSGSGGIDWLLGDSIARGVADATGIQADAIGGTTPQMIYERMHAHVKDFAGKTVGLFSGSNQRLGGGGPYDPNQMKYVEKTIKELKEVGAKVILGGVGNFGPVANKINQELDAMRAEHGLSWTGSLRGTDGRVHPRNYMDTFEQLKHPLGSGGGSRSSIESEHNVNINVHGNADPAGTARAVKDVQDRQSALHMRNLRTAIA